MGGCCGSDGILDARNKAQRKTLQIVLAINLIMFFVIVIAAIYGRSAALLTDSLDNFGDTFTYALSLYAITKNHYFKAKVAVLKGSLIFLAAMAILVQVIFRMMNPILPSSEIMGIFSFLGLMANLICLYLLTYHRHEDVNMSSVWSCSRNDIISNISVFIGAWLVWFTNNGWPDIIIAIALVIFLLQSSCKVAYSGIKSLSR